MLGPLHAHAAYCLLQCQAASPSTVQHFWVDEIRVHETLADWCLQRMSRVLTRDICSIGSPDILITEIDSERIRQHLPAELQYACQHWIAHHLKSGTQLNDNGTVHNFLRQHLLHWLEALSLMRKTSEGASGIIALESAVNVSAHNMTTIVSKPLMKSRRKTIHSYMGLFKIQNDSYCMGDR